MVVVVDTVVVLLGERKSSTLGLSPRAEHIDED
jgi:hypothetical protein